MTILDLAFWLVAPESQNALNTLHCYCAGAMGHAYVVRKRINAVEIQVYRKKGHNVKEENMSNKVLNKLKESMTKQFQHSCNVAGQEKRHLLSLVWLQV